MISEIDIILSKKKKIYISCISGMAMSGIAKFIIKSGFKGEIIGYDLKSESEVVLDLIKNYGIKDVRNDFSLFEKSEVSEVDFYIYSSATQIDSEEMRFFFEKKIDSISRIDMTKKISESYKTVINITGSRGKTSTTSFLGFLLNKIGTDCDIMSGGIINNYSSNTYFGEKNDILVIEGDESDSTSFNIKTDIAIITNIAYEHIENYENSHSKMFESYLKWLNNESIKSIILCVDDERVLALMRKIKDQSKIIKYSENNTSNANIFLNSAKLLDFNDLYINFSGFLFGRNFNNIELKLKQNGTKFGLNFLAIFSVIIYLKKNIDIEKLQNSINEYKGTFRRSTLQGSINGAMIINDYAVHPEGISFVTESFRSIIKNNGKIYTVFEPHRYSRFNNEDRIDSFSEALSKSDVILIINIFAFNQSGCFDEIKEKIITNVSKRGKKILYLDDQEIGSFLKKNLQKQDIAIFFGAGRVSDLCINILSK